MIGNTLWPTCALLTADNAICCRLLWPLLRLGQPAASTYFTIRQKEENQGVFSISSRNKYEIVEYEM
jgi:hypothetical protein